MLFRRTPRKRLHFGSDFFQAGRDEEPRPPGKRRLQTAVFLLSFVVLMGALTRLPRLKSAFLDYNYETEQIAKEMVKAEFAFDAVNLQQTEEEQARAAEKVPRTYRVDGAVVQRQIKLLQDYVNTIASKKSDVEAAVRTALLASTSAQAAELIVSQAVTEYAKGLTKDPDFAEWSDTSSLALWLMPEMETVPERQFAPSSEGSTDAPRTVTSLLEPEQTPFALAHRSELERLAREALEYTLVQGIAKQGLGDSLNEDPTQRRIVVVRENPVGDLKVSDEKSAEQIVELTQATASLTQRIKDIASRQAALSDAIQLDWNAAQSAIYMVAQKGLTDTLLYDKVATESARAQARAAVAPIMKTILAGAVIQEDGYLWTEQSRSDMATYLSSRGSQEPFSRLLFTLGANAVFVALALACLLRSTPSARVRAVKRYRDMNVMLLIICGTLILGRVVSNFEPTGFVVPIAAAAILITILVAAPAGTLAATIIAALTSIQYNYDWRILIVGGAMSYASVFSFEKVRRRSDIARAVFRATGVGLLCMLAAIFATGAISFDSIFQGVSLIGINGFLCLFLVPGLLSPFERLFGITTDIQLLEYSDLNNEILGRLAIEIPATFAHSLMMGQLAEAAADAIGANGLLARVCAYYHDIGKMRRPEYFIENQTGLNIHESMNPRLSARAIASHVLDGYEMAREYHLPQPILDGILEHHGTCLIGFFYQLALDNQKHGDVRQEDFRYPGPKPQRRETAILMICDAVESGIRSIKNPNEERVREFIDRIISARAEDRQFDDCDLTLKDLDTIGDVVGSRICSNLHTRIAYPDRQAAKTAPNVIPLQGGADR